MKRAALWLTAGLLVLVAATASAYHYSAGGSDTLATQPRETPADPSVSDELYERGTREACARDDPLADPTRRDDPDPMCGQLVYHENTTSKVSSPPDQVLFGDVGTFDARITHYAGLYGLQTCLPWCWNGLTMTAYEHVDDVAEGLGVPPGAEDRRDRGYQRYSAELRVGHASARLQGETGAWEGDGWLLPLTDQTFVAFLYDDQGEAIGPAELTELVGEDGNLAPRALPRVCGYAPGTDTQAPDAEPGCQIPFRWIGGSQADEPCQSPTYVCGTLSSTWQAQFVCGAAHGRCQAPDPAAIEPDTPLSPDPTDRLPRWQRPGDSTTAPSVWHFVVAPLPSACGGQRDPGFDVDPERAAYTYLAHDLDVYTTPDSALPGHYPLETARATAAPLVPLAGRTAAESLEPAWRERPTEPNEDASYGGVGDTSGQRTIAREWSDCRLLDDPAETRDTFDPWVNVLDNRLIRRAAGEHVQGSLEAPVGSGERARTGTYVPRGMAGYFADTDDDGRYEQAAWGEQFADVHRTGAYPVLWDMRVGAEGEPDPEAGCELSGDVLETELTLTEAMVEAGYEARTGLVQAVALDEPVAWEHRPTRQVVPFPNGGVFVLASQAIHALADNGDPTIEAHLDAVTRAAAEAAGVPAEPIVLRDVATAGPAGDAWSDFQDQCGEPTGGFTSRWALTRACPDRGACTSATAVTRLLVDNGEPAQPFLAGASWAKPFPEDHGAAFPTGLDVWTDVDRLGPAG